MQFKRRYTDIRHCLVKIYAWWWSFGEFFGYEAICLLLTGGGVGPAQLCWVKPSLNDYQVWRILYLIECKLNWDLAVNVSIFFSSCCKTFISSFILVIICPPCIDQSSPISDFKPCVHPSPMREGGQTNETERENVTESLRNFCKWNSIHIRLVPSKFLGSAKDKGDTIAICAATLSESLS